VRHLFNRREMPSGVLYISEAIMIKQTFLFSLPPQLKNNPDKDANSGEYR